MVFIHIFLLYENLISNQKLTPTHRDTHENYVRGKGKSTQNMHIPSLFPDPVKESDKNYISV